MDFESDTSLENYDRWSTTATVATTVAAAEMRHRDLQGRTPCESVAEASSSAPAVLEDESYVPALPPRAVVFHPDGTFAIGIDPLRIHELPDGDDVSEDDHGHGRTRTLEIVDLRMTDWTRIYHRHKVVFLVLIVVDMVYLLLLLCLRLTWGSERPSPGSPALEFFIDHPSKLKIAFLVVCIGFDLLVTLAAVKDYSPVLSLFVIWSIIVTAFAIVSMPLLFLFLRVILVVSAFQLRYSLSRMRNLLPPTSAAEWLVNAGQGIVGGARSLGQAVAAPFRWAASRRQPSALFADLEARGAATESQQQRQAGQERSRSSRVLGSAQPHHPEPGSATGATAGSDPAAGVDLRQEGEQPRPGTSRIGRRNSSSARSGRRRLLGPGSAGRRSSPPESSSPLVQAVLRDAARADELTLQALREGARASSRSPGPAAVADSLPGEAGWQLASPGSSSRTSYIERASSGLAGADVPVGVVELPSVAQREAVMVWMGRQTRETHRRRRGVVPLVTVEEPQW